MGGRAVVEGGQARGLGRLDGCGGAARCEVRAGRRGVGGGGRQGVPDPGLVRSGGRLGELRLGRVTGRLVGVVEGGDQARGFGGAEREPVVGLPARGGEGGVEQGEVLAEVAVEGQVGGAGPGAGHRVPALPGEAHVGDGGRGADVRDGRPEVVGPGQRGFQLVELTVRPDGHLAVGRPGGGRAGGLLDVGLRLGPDGQPEAERQPEEPREHHVRDHRAAARRTSASGHETVPLIPRPV